MQTEAFLPFGPRLKQILADKQCTAAQLTVRMGIRSQTTVSRVLNGQCAYKAARDFYQKLHLTNFLHLSQEEARSLEQSLEISRIGAAAIHARRKMTGLLRGEFPPLSDHGVHNLFSGSRQVSSLPALLDAIKGFRSVRGVLFNCCGAEMVLAFLSELMEDMDPEKVEIHHYFEIGQNPEDAADALLCLTRLGLYEGYDAYCRIFPDGGCARCFPMCRNLLHLWVTLADGHQEAYCLFAPDDEAVYINPSDGGSFREFHKAVRDHAAEYVPLKTSYEGAGEGKGLLELSERLLFLERGRTARHLLHAIRVNYIPPDAFSRFIQDAAETLGLDPEGELAREHVRIHTERYENAFRKKKPTWLLLEKDAMTRFAGTGMIEGLTPGAPPLNAGQRIRVLDTLLGAARNNPHFHLFVSKEGGLLRNLDLVCIDGLGVYICDAKVDFSAPNKRLEALLPIGSLAEALAHFFDSELLAGHALSETESVRFLESLKLTILQNETALVEHSGTKG